MLIVYPNFASTNNDNINKIAHTLYMSWNYFQFQTYILKQ